MNELVVMRVMPVFCVVMILASQSVTHTHKHSFAFIPSQDFKAIIWKCPITFIFSLHQGEFPLGWYLKVKFGSDSIKSSVTFFVLVKGILFLYHLKAYLYGLILSHGVILCPLHGLTSKTSKELRKPQRPTALHVTTCVFKRYNDLRSTS